MQSYHGARIAAVVMQNKNPKDKKTKRQKDKKTKRKKKKEDIITSI